jgi:SRSO17 transposase
MNRKMLDLYTDFLICSPHYRTATGLSDLMEGEVSHDQVTRFLAGGEYGSKELWQVVKPYVRRVETDEGVLILDDTLEEKPKTDENEVVAWYFDHSQGKSVKGMNVVSALVRYGDVALPVGFEVVRKDQEFIDPQTGKRKRRAHRSKNEIFRDLVRINVANRVKFCYVVADSWYSSQENMEYIRRKQKHFILAVKDNRLVALSLEAKRAGQFQPISSVPLENHSTVRVYIKGLEFPVLLMKQVLTNQDGSTGVIFLVCSDLSLDWEQIKEIYHKRWRIEEYHKSIKSNLGLEKSPTRTVCTQCNHIFAALCAFAKLERLRIKQGLNQFALKYKLILKATQRARLELLSLADQHT